MASEKVIFIRNLLRCWSREVLEHPPNSPNLLPCDYDLIPKLNAALLGHRFCVRNDIISVRHLTMTNFYTGEVEGIR
ncbi:hypothetical protein C0J52_15336 [Blattella germanica]|nr:hypothetical protein C0J52_15336 [Blattella germanica]